MKKITQLLILFLATLTQLKAQQTYVLTPNHDAILGYHDFTNSANTNYGNAIYYGTFSQPGAFGGVNAGKGIMTFDLSTILPGTIITDARLDLYGCGPFGVGDAASVGDLGNNSCYLERITTSWDEYTVTFNTQPHVTKEHRAHLIQSTSVDQDYLNIDVTQLVQDMINDPDHSFGFRIRLRNGSPTRALAFWSRDGAPSEDLQPHLRITIGSTKNVTDQNASQSIFNSNIYPNPFHTAAKIDFRNDYTGEEAQLKVYNLFGQIVLTLDVSNQSSIEIQRDNLSEGIYQFAIIRNSSIAEFGKFVIE